MTDITPSDSQAKAVGQILDWYRDKNRLEFYLAGYAGTGKSTVADIAIKRLQSECGVKKVLSAAYTGKAAQVLRKKGVENVQTIHSMIYSPRTNKETGELYFVNNEGSAGDADLIVLDECSMIDMRVASDLRALGKKILVMGDEGQLPPVKGTGAFTNRAPDATLHEIHRQAAESPILELATMAREGKPLPIGYQKGVVQVLELNRDTQRLIYNPHTQPLCGKNRVRWIYNQRIRMKRGFEGPVPECGERVICSRNNHSRAMFNGMMGTVRSVHSHYGIRLKSGKKLPHDFYLMSVAMEDGDVQKSLRVDPYLFNQTLTAQPCTKIEMPKKEQLDEFDFGYMITVHKAQGSSWPHVTIVDDSSAFREEKNRWLYSGLTRAIEGLTVLVRKK
jgi:exodeoxyribonuclease-5